MEWVPCAEWGQPPTNPHEPPRLAACAPHQSLVLDDGAMVLSRPLINQPDHPLRVFLAQSSPLKTAVPNLPATAQVETTLRTQRQDLEEQIATLQ